MSEGLLPFPLGLAARTASCAQRLELSPPSPSPQGPPTSSAAGSTGRCWTASRRWRPGSHGPRPRTGSSAGTHSPAPRAQTERRGPTPGRGSAAAAAPRTATRCAPAAPWHPAPWGPRAGCWPPCCCCRQACCGQRPGLRHCDSQCRLARGPVGDGLGPHRAGLMPPTLQRPEPEPPGRAACVAGGPGLAAPEQSPGPASQAGWWQPWRCPSAVSTDATGQRSHSSSRDTGSHIADGGWRAGDNHAGLPPVPGDPATFILAAPLPLVLPPSRGGFRPSPSGPASRPARGGPALRPLVSLSRPPTNTTSPCFLRLGLRSRHCQVGAVPPYPPALGRAARWSPSHPHSPAPPPCLCISWGVAPMSVREARGDRRRLPAG